MSFASMRAIQGTNDYKTRVYGEYYRASMSVRNVSPRVPANLRDVFYTAVPVCRLACQAFEERITMDALSAETDAASEYLRRVLAHSGGGELVSQVHSEALKSGRCYIVPTSRPDAASGELPRLSVVPAEDMVHRLDPYSGDIVEALRCYGTDRRDYAYYYRTEQGRYRVEHWGPARDETGQVTYPDLTRKDERTQEFDRLPVFPFLCRGAVNDPFGRPEAKDAFRLQDSLSRMMTDMSLTSATMAVPTHAIIGQSLEDFAPQKKDSDGNPITDQTGQAVRDTDKVSPTELYSNELLLLADPAAKLAEFGAAQLQNFTTGINSLTRSAASVLGVPVTVFGVSSDANPQSTSAMQQDDNRLITRSERLSRGFEPSWIALCRFLLDTGGFLDESVFVSWKDPALPTLGARSDSVSKLAQITVDGQSLYTVAQLLAKMGEPQEVIDEATRSRGPDFTHLFTEDVSGPAGSTPEAQQAR